MSISLYDSTVKTFARQLRNLSAILTKAQQWCEDNGKPHSELLEARLAPDMHPLSWQVRICTNQARNGTLLNNGTWAWTPSSPKPDDEHTFEGLQVRIQRTLEWLDGIREQDIQGGEKTPFEVPYSGKAGEVLVQKFETGHKLLMQLIFPHFWFHETTAYAICRMKGVPLGKADFLMGSGTIEW